MHLSPVSYRKYRSGFTLIELLTVVAVLAILATLLLPLINGMRQSAMVTQDAANLRSIGSAMLLYASDNGGNLPPGYFDSPDTVRMPWQARLNSYLGADPAAMQAWRTMPVWWAPGVPVYNNNTDFRHYGMNVNIQHDNWKYRMDAVDEPGRYVMVAGMNRNSEWASGAVEPVFDPLVQSSYRVTLKDGGANYLFLDGRIEFLKGDQTDVKRADHDLRPMWKWW